MTDTNKTFYTGMRVMLIEDYGKFKLGDLFKVTADGLDKFSRVTVDSTIHTSDTPTRYLPASKLRIVPYIVGESVVYGDGLYIIEHAEDSYDGQYIQLKDQFEPYGIIRTTDIGIKDVAPNIKYTNQELVNKVLDDILKEVGSALDELKEELGYSLADFYGETEEPEALEVNSHFTTADFDTIALDTFSDGSSNLVVTDTNNQELWIELNHHELKTLKSVIENHLDWLGEQHGIN